MRKRVRDKIVKRAIKKLERNEALTHQELHLIGQVYGKAITSVFKKVSFWLDGIVAAFRNVAEAVGEMFRVKEDEQT